MLSANITRSSGLLPCTSRVFQGNLFQTSLLFSPNRKRGTNRVLSVMEASAAPEAQHISANNDDVLLQYIILRRDLWAELGWPLGSVVAQGCHAATAALWLSRESPNTQQYCGLENLDHMHKVRAASHSFALEHQVLPLAMLKLSMLYVCSAS